ncbi:MAG TPA: nickel transporter permease [Candidatus Heimdallarchaeota archaeon]|nr:nickel transporter permease [Candidatus Heimdallarchaeota archaeon]
MVLHEIRHALRLIRRNPLTLTGLSIVLLLILVAILAPWLAPYPTDVNTSHIASKFQPPSTIHLCGTDELGRDIFSRLLFGCRISLTVGLFTIGLSLLIGLPLGVIAGYSGGWIDEVIMRISDMVLSFPSLLLAMAITAMLGPNLQNAMIAIAVSWWPWYTRLLRSEAISVREKDYIAAARAIGASWGRVIFKHVLRNSLTPIIIQVSVDFGAIIMTSAALSFLGLGAQPPRPEWGLMINTGRDFFLNSWWLVTFPGLAIFITVLSFNLVGDGAREILDPRLSRRGR